MTTTHTVTIGKSKSTTDMELVLPTSITARYDLMSACSRPEHGIRATVAALGLCCPRIQRMAKPLTYANSGYSIAAYGGRLLDTLVEKGADTGEVLAAGSIALNFVVDAQAVSGAGKDEVEAAAGN